MRTPTTAFAFLPPSVRSLMELPTTATLAFVATLGALCPVGTTVHLPLVSVHLDRPVPIRMDPWRMLNLDASVEQQHVRISLDFIVLYRTVYVRPKHPVQTQMVWLPILEHVNVVTKSVRL